MNKISINLLTNIILLFAGLLLLIFAKQPNVLTWVARILGALFVLPSLIYLVMVGIKQATTRTSTDFMGILPALGGICFGIVLMLKAAMFEGIVVMLMGVLMLALGVFHIIYLLLSIGKVRVSVLHFLLPLIVVAMGAAVLYMPSLRESDSLVVVLTGIALLLFNITSLQEYLADRRARRAARTAATTDLEPTDDWTEETTEEPEPTQSTTSPDYYDPDDENQPNPTDDFERY